ncbi:MAG: GntP family permease, partial [Schwartzia sp.]|nr:GntP family permease [Schwartzia sp. (in: firmicutes)]
MSGLFMGGVIFLAVLIMIVAISKFKQHPFVVLVLVSIFVGLVCGMPADKVISTVKGGFGGILSSIGIVIVAGTIIGTILEKTGAALVMANTILGIVGKARSVLTMGLTGYVTGIPVFCDSGFVILSPIARALADRSNVSLAVMGTALSAGLYATHCLVPPTPGPIAMAGTLNADLGLVILVGLITSIPAMIAGLIYAKKVASKYEIPANPEFTVEELMEKYGRL